MNSIYMCVCVGGGGGVVLQTQFMFRISLWIDVVAP